MKTWLLAVFAVLAGTVVLAYVWDGGPVSANSAEQARVFNELRPVKVPAAASGTSPEIRSLGPASPGPDGKSGKMGRAEEQAREVPNEIPYRKQIDGGLGDIDGAPANFASLPMPSPLASFQGISSNDNFAAYGFRVFPPDTIGDVGPAHYVQAVNTLFRVYDKSGNPLTPPLKISSLFLALGTACSVRDDGDPIVLYDPLADRWIISQFCKKFPPFRQMVAVSKTADPAGAYHVYEFVMPNVKLNDYPKLGVWSDAYYMTTDEFLGSNYAGSGVFAFDRMKMLNGDPGASYIYFDLASPTTIRLGGLLPADLDGIVPPPPGNPGLFLGYSATEYGDPADAVRLFEFRADFDQPSFSSFAEPAGSPLAVPPFDPTSNDGRIDIPQPTPGEFLDSQSDRLMYRAAYRNLGGSESVVVNQTVRHSQPGAAFRSGVRVHEITRQPGRGFALRSSATIGADDFSRFMAATAQDHEGNIAVGYSTSGPEKPPAIFYTGRLASEPPGMFRKEAQLIRGSGVQTAFGFRWGDYSGLSSDPADGCTFWITNQYYTLQSQNESPFGWLTRIGSFRFPECAEEQVSQISGMVTDADTGLPVTGAEITIEGSGFHRSADAGGAYGPMRVPPGSYSVTARAAGFLPKTEMVNAFAHGVAVTDFALEPTALIDDSGIQLTSESCAVNGAAEPGETVTLDIELRNTGARDATDIVADLRVSGGIVDPSPAQSYGPLAANGPAVSRPFTFTIGPGVACGAAVILEFAISDAGQALGLLNIGLDAGRPRIVLQEDFDGTAAPDLPAGWATTASGGQSPWVTSVDRAESPPNSAFSPDPRVVGINELVTPSFDVLTPNAELSFRNWYELETTFLRNRLYDGSVLEIDTGNGWQDILDAGGSFRNGGYDLGVIDSCCSNPLAGRRAWSGRSGVNEEPEFIDSVVKLPASAAGRSVRLRWRIGTDIGTFRRGQYIDDLVVTDGFACDCAKARPQPAPFDFDGDGKTDQGVFTASDDPNVPDFLIRSSLAGIETGHFWGSDGDVPVNADYDGDGRTDLAVFRPSSGIWFLLNSSDGLFRAVTFGLSDDIPVPADFDGDGKAEIAVYRPSGGFWFYLRSSDGAFHAEQFGVAEDFPVNADYDGDGKSDVAVFRPSDGVWYISKSSDASFRAMQFGQAGDRPVPGDFDGDGIADISLFRPSEGIWYQHRSAGGFFAAPFGVASDQPLQADFDGDGRRDIGVFRASNAGWYFLKSSDGSIGGSPFGRTGDGAVPGIFVR